MSAPEELDRLIHHYLEGTLAPEDATVLNERLKTDPAAAGRLAQFAHDQVHLRSLFGPIEIPSASGDPSDRETSLAASLPARRGRGPSDRSRARRRSSARRPARTTQPGPGVYLTLAASLMLLAGIGFLLTGRTEPRRTGTTSRRAPSALSTRDPRTGARLSRAAAPQAGQPAASARAGPRTTARRSLVPFHEDTSQRSSRSPVPAQPDPEPPGLPTPATPPAEATIALAPRPAPAPEQAQRGQATGQEEQTDRPLARIDWIEGPVMYARGTKGPWRKAIQGIALLLGDRIDTRTGLARLQMAAGARAYANKGTVLRLQRGRTAAGYEPVVRLVRGEVFVEEVTSRKNQEPGLATSQVHVETPDGLVSPLGTRFDVKFSGLVTWVVVAEGAVEVRTRRRGGAPGAEPWTTDLRREAWSGTAVRVAAGFRTRVFRGTRPTPPIRADVAKAIAWATRRVRRGLLALYRFEAGTGTVVHDVSGAGEPLDLTLAGGRVRWVPGGGLRFVGADHDSIATSRSPAAKVLAACTASDEITLEAWVRPGNLTQTGPARIVVLDDPAGERANLRNFAMGQGTWRAGLGRGEIEFRLRTTTADLVDLLAPAGMLAGTRKPYHVVCTYRRRDGMRIYVNNALRATKKESGRLETAGPNAWNAKYVLSLGNRTTSLDRDWEGTLYLVAVYDRALRPFEIAQNYQAGPRRRERAGRQTGEETR